MLRMYVNESARAVAETAGIAHSLVSFIEHGERLDPRASTAIALGRVFGVSVEWLVEGKGDPPTKEGVVAAYAQARAAREAAA